MDLEHLSETAGAVPPGERRLRADLIEALQYLKAACKEAEERLFTRACSSETRDNGLKLEKS